MRFKVSFYVIVGDCKNKLLKSDAMVRCRLRFAARAGALLLSIDSQSTVDRQSIDRSFWIPKSWL